jgi:hypothetical protein
MYESILNYWVVVSWSATVPVAGLGVSPGPFDYIENAIGETPTAADETSALL